MWSYLIATTPRYQPTWGLSHVRSNPPGDPSAPKTATPPGPARLGVVECSQPAHAREPAGDAEEQFTSHLTPEVGTSWAG